MAGRGIAQLVTGSFILYVKPVDFGYLGGFIPGVPMPTPFFIALFVAVNFLYGVVLLVP
jgi:ribose/xylose/arabinose/galactoside ABC-type transport system permease subunit